MAAPNIEERRLAVSNLIKDIYTTKDIGLIAKQFNCSYASVRADIVELKRENKIVIYPSFKTKQYVLDRDNYTCQYCLINNVTLIVDHVIPSFMGGVGSSYNLVACCQSCNMYKKNKVWLPINSHLLKEENINWYNKILKSL